MVFAASQMNDGHKTSSGINDRDKACEELILQRRKTNSPTIEDDFTVDLDDDEPFDEPKSPQKGKRNIAKGDEIDNNMDAEINMLCWSESDLDADDGKKENRPAIGDSKERTDISHVSSSSSSCKLKNNQIMNQKDDTMDESKNFQSEFDNTTNISPDDEQIDRIDEGENESAGFRSKLETNQFEQRDEVEDNNKSSRSTHSLVWSGSDLDDVKSDNIDDQIEDHVDHVDQRDDNIVKTQENEEQREESADDRFGKHSNQSSTRIDDSMKPILMKGDGGLLEEERRQCNSSTKGHSEENLQDDQSHMKNDNNNVGEERPQQSEAHAVAIADHDTDKSNPHEDIGIRVELSTDSLMEGIEPDNYGCDERSALSLAASVTPSVTKRTRNTKTRSKYPKHPKSPCCSSVFTDAGISIGQSTVATADIEAGMATGVNAMTCSLLRPKKVKENGSSADAKKESNEGDEDLLDRFFENIESRVCPTPKEGGRIAERDRNNEDGFKRLINPFIDRLEQFDSVFEQIESIACPEEDENGDAITIRTPVAFAAAKFNELLDKIEACDPNFVKSKENTRKSNCNFEFNEDELKELDEDMPSENTPYEADDLKELDEDMPSENNPYEALEKAIQTAEKMVKEQKRSSFDKKDQLQKLKEQWFATRLKWKLKQAILAEVVKQKTAEAAKTTTKCMDTVVSSCHQPSMSSVAESNSETKKNKDNNTKNRTKQNKASILKTSNGHESEVDTYDDASSIDQSGFFSVMTPSEGSKINSKPNDFRSDILSPSEHSNIYSGRQNFRSTMHGAASEDEISASFFSLADNSVRSPRNLLSPSSRNCPSEHSNINSGGRNFRSNMHGAASEDEISASFLSFTDTFVRSPRNLSPSSRNGDSVGSILSDGPSDEEGDDDGTNVGVTIGVSTAPLAVIAEEAPSAESMTSDDTSNRKDPKNINPEQKSKPAPKKTKPQQKSKPALRRWAYPAPSYYTKKSTNPLEWFDKLKGTVESVYTVSERILDRAQCASATINFAESNSFEDDHEESHHQVHNRPSRGDSTRSSSTRPMTRQNSIVEDDNYSVSIIAEPEKKVCTENYYESSVCDDDDLSGFESALNTMDSEQDERPPMLRLLKERNDSRSCGSTCEGSESNRSKSKVGSVHSRLSSEVPEGYSLVDSIRHASLSTRNNEANRTRVSQEPRGNKLKNDPSAHVRIPPHLFPPPPPTPNTKKEDSNFRENTQQRIRSPRSSETNETSDMTAVSASSSYVAVTKLVDSTHSKRSMVISVETPKAKESVSFGTFSHEHPADDDGDKGTVFSYNTSSTGSAEFKDCYQDTIPSFSTMGTVPEDEKAQSPADITEQNLQKANVAEINLGTAFLPSDENIVKSMALLSVSATVFNKSEKYSNLQAESAMHEIESVPSASYHKSEILEDTIVEENPDSEPLPMESLKNKESKEPLAMLQEDEDTMENDGKKIHNPLIDHDGNDFDGKPDHLVLESKQGNIFTEESREGIVEDPAMGTDSKEFPSKSVKESDLPQQLSTCSSSIDDRTEEYYLQTSFETSFEKDIAVDRIMEEETFDSDEFILESLKHQESLNHMEEQLSMVKAIGNSSSKQKAVTGELMMIEAPIVEGMGEDSITMEPPKLQMSLEGNEAKITSSKKKVSSKIKGQLSVEDRRKRRLRQRRKFDAVLRGEDDSSSTSSSTMQGGRNATALECNDESQLIVRVPLISASFDTGFQ